MIYFGNMTRVFLYLSVILIAFTGCKKKTEGCGDPLALNTNLGADELNQEKCRFSSVTFYAGSSTFEGIEVEKITITIGTDTEPIGTITTFNQPYPASCGETGTVLFDFGQSGVSRTWSAALELANNGLVHTSGDFEPDPNEECIRIDVMPN